jgi:general stress protein 26
MGLITKEMEQAIAETALCYVATVNEDGTPNLSPKASLTVIDEDTLGFCNVASPGTVANLRRNPALEVNIVDIFTRRGFRFRGTAALLKEGADFDLVASRFLDRAGPDYVVLDVVRITVSAAQACNSPLYAVYPDSDPAEVRRAYLKRYTGMDP